MELELSGRIPTDDISHLILRRAATAGMIFHARPAACLGAELVYGKDNHTSAYPGLHFRDQA